MTKEELEKATGQELIDERNYCGVDGYYGDYLDDVNAEMLKRFNRLAELKKRCANYEMTISKMEKGTCDICKETEKDKKIEELEKACKETQELLDRQIEATYRLDKENAELKENNKVYCEGNGETLVVNVSFDSFTRINANHRMYYPHNSVKELQEENAELKHTIATLRQEKDNVSMHAKAMEVVAKTRSDQFTKAKELLERFLGLGNLWDLDCKDYFPLRKETEQFLNSEVEK